MVNVKKVFFTVSLFSGDEVEVRVDRKCLGTIEITINGCTREASIDDESAPQAAKDMFDRILSPCKPTRNCPELWMLLCTGSELREYSDLLLKVAG